MIRLIYLRLPSLRPDVSPRRGVLRSSNSKTLRLSSPLPSLLAISTKEVITCLCELHCQKMYVLVLLDYAILVSLGSTTVEQNDTAANTGMKLYSWDEILEMSILAPPSSGRGKGPRGCAEAPPCSKALEPTSCGYLVNTGFLSSVGGDCVSTLPNLPCLLSVYPPVAENEKRRTPTAARAF
ncbi:hypothetical protein ZIOFF_007629 [Zingiber officinale]|uniref:Uncharacterized protein n=1 Tax=Zingiber officinale TaxID=94328 RepID=A0A8J5I215_ZINOF|nr:hypothetical protein ZIOFF_007629 [Zingiber officinale]